MRKSIIFPIAFGTYKTGITKKPPDLLGSGGFYFF